MRVLLDNNLSPRLVALLGDAGWDAVHVRDLDLAAASDANVLAAARDAGRVLVSGDTDFGALLAASRATAPSVVLVRRVTGRRAEAMAATLLANLSPLSEDLDSGAVVALGDDSVRVRRLPLA
ncbi:MAG TPA: DUF5615 family PIN-like protein [Frankiaceae bacterium]|jgi:predicted nuclease of predicted toxin-antitoxin system|nr:DUF5615 family PIN-like protein [Frankiaceae bacterium]